MKKYYRINTFYHILSSVIPIDLPDGLWAIQLVFTNKKKALAFLREQNLSKDFLEEICLEHRSKKW